MKHTSVIELSKSAYKKNIRFFRKIIGKKAQFYSVVKGNAYGHGVEEFIPLAEECEVNNFAVAHAHEAEDVLKVKKKESDIMIMGMIENDELEWAVENEISFFVFDIPRLKAAQQAGEKIGKPAKIHIELETGFHRTGFEEHELAKVVETFKTNTHCLSLKGLCTHYAGAESVANYLRVMNQIQTFKSHCTAIELMGLRPKYHHTACSAAVLTYPETIMDLVRVGIAQYGFWPSPETRMHNLLTDKKVYSSDPLKRVLKWKSRIMSFKNVSAGEFISYGTSYMTTKKERLAVVPVGYSHGFSRSLSNVGHVLIRGRKAPIVGMVNMSMVLVSVTNANGCEIGDEVVLIGRQGKNDISVASFSELSRNVNYELLTRLPQDIPRIVVN